VLLELFPQLLRVGVVRVRRQRLARLLEALLEVAQLERQQRVVVEGLERVLRQPGAYTRSLQSSTGGPSGHIAHIRAQLEHLRDTSMGYVWSYGGHRQLKLSGKGQSKLK